MSSDGWISLGVILAVFLGLQRRRGAPADLLFLGGLVIVTLLGIISPGQALEGFANPAVITIGALFVVASGLRNTGALDMLGHQVLGQARDEQQALRRLAFPIVGLSAVMNNTPIVAMLVPIAVDWCRKRGVSPSRLLIPISYLAILGGVCTLIGTSTNLLINGMLFTSKQPTLSFFEIGYVGIPCAVLGSAYLLLFSGKVLPNRTDLIEQLGEHRREYLVELLVQPECRLIGQTVEQAGLRHLQGLFLIEIDRDGEFITPVAPEDMIHVGDRLVFTGIVTTIVELEKIPGLVPAADLAYEVHPGAGHQRHLTEAVLSNTSPLIGETVRGAKFRQRYNAAIVAIHRNGKRLTSKVGDVKLEAGDTLLLQTRTEFVKDFRHSPDFHLVSSVEGSQTRRHDRVWVAVVLLALLVAWLSLGTLLLNADWAGPIIKNLARAGRPPIVAIAIAGLMIVTRCISVSEARTSIDLQVLITIGAALGLGSALTESKAVDTIASGLVEFVGTDRPFLLLLVIYLLTLVFTEMITNAAVAALMFPLALAVASEGQISPRPLVMAIAIAASSSFVTPIGYQTNLMVMGPGGYHPRDFLKAGFPLVLIVMVTALVLIPVIWPFQVAP